MGRIRLLDASTANGIAAGEVVERPASVVKELIENALDAGAANITIEIIDGGIKMIRVTDDGCGMDSEDVVSALLCHATSKLTELSDLMDLNTFGFRGEALSSIAAVSKMTIRSQQSGEAHGRTVYAEAGKILRKERSSGVPGTTIEIRDLFYNFPARYKFLKKDQTEAQHIIVLCERFVLIRSDISFRFIRNGKVILHSPGDGNDKSALYCVYGNNLVSNTIEIQSDFVQVKVQGFIGKPVLARSGRSEQTIFVNDRLIRSKTITAAIDEAYKTFLMKGKYAFVVLKIYVSPSLVDVNVHPQKSEVRFWNDSEVFRAVFHSIRGALQSVSLTGEGRPEQTDQASYCCPEDYDQTSSFQKNSAIEKKNSADPFYTPKPKSFEAIVHEVEAFPHALLQTKIDSFPLSSDCHSTRMKSHDVIELQNARFIGSLFLTYLLFESPEHFIVMDQHAAHEKVLYEKLLEEMAQKKDQPITSQKLLVPIIISLTASQTVRLEENKSYFRMLGFEIDPIGEFDYAVRYAPSFCPAEHIVSVLKDLIEHVENDLNQSDDSLLLSLATSACKAAVKASDALDPAEVNALVSDLTLLERPFSCPHGRPTILFYSKNFFEKEFKRIV